MAVFDVVVIGAGAAGLMAAIKAAENKARVIVLEHMPQAARKLRITGKGRCNLTNIAPKREFLEHIGKNKDFLHSAFSVFFSEELIAFFNKIGVKTITERGGRVFPESGKAVEISQALLQYCKKLHIEIRTNTSVREIIKNEEGRCVGVKTSKENILAKNVILATGGKSYPATGSTGDGYILLQKLGHSIVPLRPVLVPLKIDKGICKQLEGLSLKNVRANVWINEKKEFDMFGDLDFISTGISGPIILTISRKIINQISENQKIELIIDLKPALDEVKLDARLQRDFLERNKEKLSDILRGLLPQKLIPVCLNTLKLKATKPGNQINSNERKILRNWLKAFKVEVLGYGSWEEAIVTAGGISLLEVDSKDMQSKLVKNLYIAGEVLDLDADTGGYNLQIAFSTGVLAGISAAKR